MKNIDMENFLERFREEYKYLYEANEYVAGYDEAVRAGDEFISSHKEFVRAFACFRGDVLSSDREVAAFMFALARLNKSQV